MRHPSYILVCLVSLFAYVQQVSAAVLPDERADLMQHSYDGGELEVSGPAILIRKNIGSSTSVFYNMYTDNITSASIDVQISGSAYEESRTEQTLGVDFLSGKTTLNFSITDSTENDYEASTISLGVSQDFFGDLSTLTMGFARGNDDISARVGNDPLEFEARSSVIRYNYRLGFTQILTKNATISVGFETITDEATSAPGSTTTLNNPYRQYSYRVDGSPDVRGFAFELYPSTRTSNAMSLRGNYFLPWKGAIHYEYRMFQDSWGIRANNIGVTYVQPISHFVLELRYRVYSQTQADFYQDLFDREGQFTFMARDKELSTYSSTAIGFGVSYEFAKNGWGWIDKGSLNFSYDLISFEYDNFRDATENVNDGIAAGTESFYAFDAKVMQIFASIWY
ncbi:hypothetical protein MNBD_GAMMA21-2988 [hydrothermal vent metagenome]|uniref:DUF3570 domain-containing protein n=1 Tax=hydrothermal vent metagenome TaxID=652676 RepID=A0A3B0ZSE8_9ZZZZ